MNETTHTDIEGTPMECGAQVFSMFVLPCLKATTMRPHQERAEFYSGLLMATLGAMAADLGHEQASKLMHALGDSFDTMADLLKPQTQH